MITEKKCKGPCGLTKSVDEFHWKSKRKGTRQTRCKECMSQYGHSHYVANSQQYKDRANTRLTQLRADNRLAVETWLTTNPCSKCGESNSKVLSTSLTSQEINNLSQTDLTAKLQASIILCRNCEAAEK